MEIYNALENWIAFIGSEDETKRAYRRAVEFFMAANKMNAKFSTEQITHNHYEAFLAWLKKKTKNKNSRAIYSIGVIQFFSYLVFHEISTVNIEKCKYLKNKMLPRFTYKLKTFIQSDVDELLEATDSFIERLFENENAKLRAYRDRAFILTLADTGLRVHEACELIRGDIDQEKARAVIVGKGDKQGVIRFSERSLNAINDYFRVRAELDGASGKPLLSLPVFAQHAKSSGKKVEPITTKTGRDIVTYWVLRILGDAKKKTITPHTLRHYFVTEVVNTTGNIKTAKEMARHSNISVTDKYAQLNDAQLDREYHEIFNNRNRPR